MATEKNPAENILASIELLKKRHAVGDIDEIEIDPADFQPMDADQLAYLKYQFDRWDD